jgi:predicted transcriptional regulator
VAAVSGTQQRSLLLSVRPRFADAILDSSKTVELRRTRIHTEPGMLVVLYSSTPVKAIVGTARVRHVESLTPDVLWRRVATSCSVSRREFDDYFCDATLAHGLHLSDPRRLALPVPLDLLRSRLGAQPPQSFRYLTGKQADALLETAPAGTAGMDRALGSLFCHTQDLLGGLVRRGPGLLRHAVAQLPSPQRPPVQSEHHP